MSVRSLTVGELAAPETPCARCTEKRYAAGRHPQSLCLVCDWIMRRKNGSKSTQPDHYAPKENHR